MGKNLLLTVGQVVGKLTIVEYRGTSTWFCKCECGATVEKSTRNIVNVNSPACDICTAEVKRTRITDMIANRESNQRQHHYEGSTVNGWSIDSYSDVSKKYAVRCMTCDNVITRFPQNVAIALTNPDKPFRACKVCHPSKTPPPKIKDPDIDLNIEMSFVEIAEALNLPTKQVENLFYKAIKKITISSEALNLYEYLNMDGEKDYGREGKSLLSY